MYIKLSTMYKRQLAIIISILAIIIASLSSLNLKTRDTQQLEVDFLSVGQGDSILIKTPSGHNILVDGGPDNSVLDRLAENLGFWDRRIDLMILTNPHDDHVTGLLEVLKRYEVGQIAATGVLHTTQNYISWLELIRDKKIPMLLVNSSKTIEFGSTTIEFIFPEKDYSRQEADNLNNTSIVTLVKYGDSRLLLMGDAEEQVEQQLLASKKDISADLIKLGHHGSDTSNSEEFLRAVAPELAVIEVGEENKFNHPSPRVLKRLERLGVSTLRTDRSGTIRAASRGDEFYIMGK
jgi:competence protein ComEC